MPIVGLTHANLGYSLYEWNDLETAKHHLQIAIELSERVKAARALLFSQVFLSKVLAAQGQLNDALEILRKAEWLVQEHQLPVLRQVAGVSTGGGRDPVEGAAGVRGVEDGCRPRPPGLVCGGVRVRAGSRYERCALVPFTGQPIHPDERREGDLVVRGY